MDIIPLCDDRFGLLCFDLLPHLSWHLIPSAETYFSNTCISLALVSGLMITSSAPFEMNNSMSVGRALPVTPARQREQMYTAVRYRSKIKGETYDGPIKSHFIPHDRSSIRAMKNRLQIHILVIEVLSY